MCFNKTGPYISPMIFMRSDFQFVQFWVPC